MVPTDVGLAMLDPVAHLLQSAEAVHVRRQLAPL